MTSLSDAVTLLGACSAPSEAFWRLPELGPPQVRAPLRVGGGLIATVRRVVG